MLAAICVEAVQVRLNHLEDESRRDGGVECVATALENRHPALRGKPVCGAHHPEGALQLRACGEAHHSANPLMGEDEDDLHDHAPSSQSFALT